MKALGNLNFCIDLCGPFQVCSYDGAKYTFTLGDDFSRKVFVSFLKHKSETMDVFEELILMLENQAES